MSSSEKKATVGSKECQEQSQCEENTMVLQCSHQKVIEAVSFPILQGINHEKTHYDLLSEPPAGYMVGRYNFEEKYILHPVDFKYTLARWIKMGEEVFDSRYEGWGVVRLSNWVRKVILAIFEVVFGLHDRQLFHGFLQHPENYGIRETVGIKNEVVLEVILFYNNRGRDKLGEPTNVAMGIEYDMMGLSSLIFDRLLSGKPYHTYPEDLKDLHLLMKDIGSIGKNRGLIRSHTSLWKWSTRHFYFEKLWEKYNGGDPVVQEKIKVAMGRVKTGKNWKNRLLAMDSPLGKLYKNNSYRDNDPMEFVRFVRIGNYHIDDIDHQTGLRVYIEGKPDYENPQYIEMEMAKLYPMLLTETYVELCNVGVFL